MRKPSLKYLVERAIPSLGGRDAGHSWPLDMSAIGGPKGPEPTRYGDWEYNGRCTDF